MAAATPEGSDFARRAQAGTLEGFFRTVAGVEAAAAGEQVANPLLEVGPELEARWTEFGVNLAEVREFRAVRLDGRTRDGFWGTFVNRDPRTVLVLGPGFNHGGNVYSRGPVLMLGEAHLMGDLLCESWVHIGDEAFPRGIVYASHALVGPQVHGGQARSVLTRVTHVDLPVPGLSRQAWIRSLLATRSIREVVGILSGRYEESAPPSQVGRPVALDEILSPAQYEAVVQALPESAQIQSILLEGRHYGARAANVVNERDDLLIVIPPTYSSHGSVYSAGPVLILGAGVCPRVKSVLSLRRILLSGSPTIADIIALEDVTRGLPEPPPGEWTLRMFRERTISEVRQLWGRGGPTRSAREAAQPGSLRDLVGGELYEVVVRDHPEAGVMECLVLEGGDERALNLQGVLNEERDVLIAILPSFRLTADVFSAGPIVILGDGNGPSAMSVVSARWIVVQGRHHLTEVVCGE